jgi:hypothetical protein
MTLISAGASRFVAPLETRCTVARTQKTRNQKPEPETRDDPVLSEIHKRKGRPAGFIPPAAL